MGLTRSELREKVMTILYQIELYQKNSIEYINGEIVLTKREIDLLNDLEINYKGYTSMALLISAIEEAAEDDPEIEEILKDMSDRNYYLNTKK